MSKETYCIHLHNGNNKNHTNPFRRINDGPLKLEICIVHNKLCQYYWENLTTQSNLAKKTFVFKYSINLKCYRGNFKILQNIKYCIKINNINIIKKSFVITNTTILSFKESFSKCRNANNFFLIWLLLI